MTIVAVVAGVVLTQFDSSARDQLVGTAQAVVSDIAHARNLAVTNNSKYKITFDRATNSLSITHAGTNSALDVLPSSAFHSAESAGTSLVTRLAALPLASDGVDLAWTETSSYDEYGTGEAVTDVEFGPLGETTRSLGTTIWLSAGVKGDRTFLPIHIDPITGIASIGSITAIVPASLEEEEAASEEESYSEEYYDEYTDESDTSTTDSTTYEYSELDFGY